MSPAAGWENFYVIAGSSAGALIGLQFVVITLIAGTPAADGGEQGSRTFATPTIVHLGAVLLLAAVLSAPWHGLAPAAWIWGLIGLCGVIYLVAISWRMARQTVYKPEAEDWIFHAVLPLAAYATLGLSALASGAHPRGALFAVAAAALVLLFTAIHNAWDSVTYHVFASRRRAHAQQRERQGAPR
ncbi:MAG: hypothetical protein ACRD2E_06470 [Terriglobales bacterium]